MVFTMTHLISNAETADDILRYIKSGTADVPDWVNKLIEHIDYLDATVRELEAELRMLED